MVYLDEDSAMKRPKISIEPDPVIEAYKKGIDRTLVRQNLRLTVEQRIEELMKLQQFAEEVRRAGREAERQR